jgi:hypothetical protein
MVLSTCADRRLLYCARAFVGINGEGWVIMFITFLVEKAPQRAAIVVEDSIRKF